MSASTKPSIVHIGLHKTATTSLQMNLFRVAGRPYFGLHGAPDWHRRRLDWFSSLMASADPPAEVGHEPFVFSDESVLLRAGGLAGAPALAERIRAIFPGAKVLVTVRRPSSVLVSTYFQSIRVRRNAIGFCGNRPICSSSLRFHDFESWWNLALAHRASSIAGLLAYSELASGLQQGLGEGGVEFLPMEWIRGAPARYGAVLSRLGFEECEVAGFMSARPENTRDSKTLDRIRPWAFEAGERLNSLGLDNVVRPVLRGPLRLAIERLAYSGEKRLNPPGGPTADLLAEIDARYGDDWQQVAGKGLFGSESTP